MSSTVVHWRFSPATVRSLRVLVYAAVGLTVGPFLGFVVLLLTVLAREGGGGLAALVVALVVAFGVGSGRVVFALASDEVSTTAHEDTRALSRAWLVASALAGAGLGSWGLLRAGAGFGLVVGCVVAGFLLLAVGAGLRTEGRVDTGERTLEYDGVTVPLDAVRRVRSKRVGRFCFALVSYHRGRVGPSAPRWVALSTEARDVVESARRSGGGDGDGRVANPAEDVHSAPRAVRWVAAAFGVGCLATGPGLWHLLSATGSAPAFTTSLVAFGGALGAVFGAVFLRYALVA